MHTGRGKGMHAYACMHPLHKAFVTTDLNNISLRQTK
jgi:hypothetical protein